LDDQKLSKFKNGYRNSVVFLKVNKVTDTGAVVTERGTGFLVSKRGHILTSCHTVERLLRDELGEPKTTKVDAVEIAGAIGSTAGTPEPVEFLRCDPVPTDIALLKFKNTNTPRTPMLVGDATVLEGFEQIATMGFPLDTEFFFRSGRLGGVAEDDTFIADITLDFGDSGAPIVNSDLQVIGLVIGGKGENKRIGVIRPINYAANFLNMLAYSLRRRSVQPQVLLRHLRRRLS
jgi:S1-C subfamily serine protease